MKPNFIDDLVFDFQDYKMFYMIASHRDNWKVVGHRYKTINVPASFDIETSSFYIEGEKQACMYCWQFGLNGLTLLGRTWHEYIEFMNYLNEKIGKNKLLVFVHNLSYEFQFMRNWFRWESVFAIRRRTPVKAVWKNIEYRCSLFLSGYSLETVGKNLLKYRVNKLVGDLDYNLIRHTNTPLTGRENAYRINDVRVVMAYIAECIENDGDITKIPLTKTGYVRKHCRQKCLYGDNPKYRKVAYIRWRQLFDDLTLTPEEYLQCKRAFQGGFTHANAIYVNKVVKEVGSADFTSDYPYQMVAKYFPMSKSRLVDGSEVQRYFFDYIEKYCCMFDITFYELTATKIFEQPLSWSRCWGIDREVLLDKKVKDEYLQLNNGRVVYCKKCSTTITELDYKILRRFYKWERCEIFNFRIYHKGRLPKQFVNSILDFYENKTSLKGVIGKEVEYAKSKNNLNSCYGMAVTDICREINEYNNGWLSPCMPNLEESIDDYNNKMDRFLFYPWGIWVTAHARYSLFTAIWEFKNDYIYSDTDSIKGINFQNHREYFENYNRGVEREIEKAAEFYQIPKSRFAPKNLKGQVKTIGVWDMEGTYDYFKTCGAKRYMTLKGDTISITVAGLGKIKGLEYLLRKNGIEYEVDENKNIHIKNDPLTGLFDDFKDEMYIPAEETGKLTHTYIDRECKGIIKDYLGNYGEYYEKSFIHMEAASFEMSFASEFKKYLDGKITEFFDPLTGQEVL